MSVKTLKRIFGLFKGSLLGIPKLAPKVKTPKQLPAMMPLNVRRKLRTTIKQRKRAERIRQKLARRTMRAHVK